MRCSVVENKTLILVQRPEDPRRFRRGGIDDLQVNARVVPIVLARGVGVGSGGIVIAQSIMVFPHTPDMDFNLGDGVTIEVMDD